MVDNGKLRTTDKGQFVWHRYRGVDGDSFSYPLLFTDVMGNRKK